MFRSKIRRRKTFISSQYNRVKGIVGIGLVLSLLTGNVSSVKGAEVRREIDAKAAVKTVETTENNGVRTTEIPANVDDETATLPSTDVSELSSSELSKEHVDSNSAAVAVAEPIVFQTSDAALLVVGSTTLSAGDNAIKARLENLGFTVTVKDGPGVMTADATGKRLIFISETVVGADVNTKFNGVTVPLVVSEPIIYGYTGMTGTVAGTDFSNSTPSTQLVINDPSHQLAAWLTGMVTVTNSPQPLAWGKPSANAFNVASVAGAPGQSAVFGYERGAAMVAGTAPARRVGIFLHRTVPESLNGNGWSLFDAAVNWAAKSALLVAGQPEPTASDLTIKSHLESIGYKVRMKSGSNVATSDAVARRPRPSGTSTSRRSLPKTPCPAARSSITRAPTSAANFTTRQRFSMSVRATSTPTANCCRAYPSSRLSCEPMRAIASISRSITSCPPPRPIWTASTRCR